MSVAALVGALALVVLEAGYARGLLRQGGGSASAAADDGSTVGGATDSPLEPALSAAGRGALLPWAAWADEPVLVLALVLGLAVRAGGLGLLLHRRRQHRGVTSLSGRA